MGGSKRPPSAAAVPVSGAGVPSGDGFVQRAARALNLGRLASLRIGGLLIVIVAVMVVFSLVNSAFASPANFLGLLRAMSTLAIVALGETLVIVSGELDLSIGSTYGLASTLMAVAWIEWKVPVYIAIPMALIAACGIGGFNAFFTTVLRIPSFIVTLGSLSIVQGLTLLLSNSQTFNAAYAEPPVNPGQLAFFTGLSNIPLPLGLPAQVVWLAVLAVIFFILLHRSLFGFRLLAIGGNQQAAQLARLPVRKYKLIAFVICGVMAAIASILDFAFIGTTQPNAGESLTFPVFAAVIIGGASLSGGRGTVFGTLMGSLLLAVLANGLALIGVGSFVQLLFIGTVTIGAVALDRWSSSWRRVATA
jgi:ribose/xylose/arabinose/galactoside ABC-type transport system permease subunit